MTETDGRLIDRRALDVIRRMAFDRVESGEDVKAVMESYGLCRTTYYKWEAKRQERGVKELVSLSPPGRPSPLTESQKSQVFMWINGKDPRQYGFDFGLWTRKIVSALVLEKFKIAMGVTAVGRLLAELNITPQKPLRRAYERDPEAVRIWQEETYPKIRERAKRRGAEIFFLDEAGIRSDDPLGRTWAPRGKTPIVQTSGQRQSINVISAVNPSGAFWFKAYNGRMNAGLFKEFLGDFLKYRKKPVIMIVDGHPSHKAKLIAKYIDELKGKLELHFLPGYSPDLNPDEFVWNHMRNKGVTKKPLRQNEALRDRVESDLLEIKASPRLVRSFFKAKSVAYILD
ncbi:MAG TPA: IS630 family transposase [Spirochaetia bacterium]|nr:IS630 family transposase [Spirochaetia bacterium]